jgi:hypothetical protein
MCFSRAMTLARGLEGAAVVPNSYFQLGSFIRHDKSFPLGCAINKVISKPRAQSQELYCKVPVHKVTYLSGISMWALDSLDLSETQYSREEFRTWVRTNLPPGHSRLTKQIELSKVVLPSDL